MQEKRRFPRASYPCKVLVSTDKETEEFSLHTENISSGGVRIIFQKPQPINTPLDIEVVVGKRRVSTKGRVVWVLEIKSPGAGKADLFDTGIEFTQLNTEDREFLSKMIEELLDRAE